MPSAQVGTISGGMQLVSGNPGSGLLPKLVGGVQLKHSSSGIGPIFVGVTPNLYLSGNVVTISSGGGESSGGLQDGFELAPGDALFIPVLRLASGPMSIRLAAPAAASGTRIFWETF